MNKHVNLDLNITILALLVDFVGIPYYPYQKCPSKPACIFRLYSHSRLPENRDPVIVPWETHRAQLLGDITGHTVSGTKNP